MRGPNPIPGDRGSRPDPIRRGGRSHLKQYGRLSIACSQYTTLKTVHSRDGSTSTWANCSNMMIFVPNLTRSGPPRTIRSMYRCVDHLATVSHTKNSINAKRTGFSEQMFRDYYFFNLTRSGSPSATRSGPVRVAITWLQHILH